MYNKNEIHVIPNKVDIKKVLIILFFFIEVLFTVLFALKFESLLKVYAILSEIDIIIMFRNITDKAGPNL
jgi:hypothetical protein